MANAFKCWTKVCSLHPLAIFKCNVHGIVGSNNYFYVIYLGDLVNVHLLQPLMPPYLEICLGSRVHVTIGILPT